MSETKEKEVTSSSSAPLLDEIPGAEAFFEKNKSLLTWAGGAVAAVVALVLGYQYYTTTQNKEAQSEMFQAIYYFESDSLKKALDGDGNRPGFLEIIDSYGGTKAANLAHYYAGVSYLKLGKFDEAIEQLNAFGASDVVLQGKAYCLLGDAHLEKNDLDQAVSWYEKASSYKPNKYFTPVYLMKLGLAHELKKDFGAAAQVYDKVISEYPVSPQYPDALKAKAYAEAKAGN